ncbi:MAG: DUF6503 family protein [Bacteroidota bacterium]
MIRTVLWVLLFSVSACKLSKSGYLTAQEVIDASIAASGGALYKNHETSFFFRDRRYISTIKNGKKILKRVTFSDTLKITDVKTGDGFERFFNDTLMVLPDSVSTRYANSVNSVHYFARLPYGLNDFAVNKELIGEVDLDGKKYYKVKITFDQEGGGADFDDVYLYWINKETFKPDFLAYEFHVDGGGFRFRKAYNERFVSGIRFVDYENYKPRERFANLMRIDSLFEAGGLELLSKIELSVIKVTKID